MKTEQISYEPGEVLMQEMAAALDHIETLDSALARPRWKGQMRRKDVAKLRRLLTKEVNRLGRCFAAHHTPIIWN